MRSARAVTVTLCLLAAPVSFAEEMPVAAELQGEIFKRVLSFDRTLADRARIDLLVVYQDVPTGLVGDVLSSFQKAGIVASTTSAADLPNVIDQAAVVYFAPGTDVDAFGALCADASSADPLWCSVPNRGRQRRDRRRPAQRPPGDSRSPRAIESRRARDLVGASSALARDSLVDCNSYSLSKSRGHFVRWQGAMTTIYWNISRNCNAASGQKGPRFCQRITVTAH